MMMSERVTRKVAGHYEVTTEHGVFKIDNECGLWFVVAPDGTVRHAALYSGARKIVNKICQQLSGNYVEGL